MNNFRRPIGIVANEYSDITVVCDDGSSWQRSCNESLFVETSPVPGTKRDLERKGHFFCSLKKDSCEHFVYEYGPNMHSLCGFDCTLEPVADMDYCPLIKIKEDTENAFKED